MASLSGSSQIPISLPALTQINAIRHREKLGLDGILAEMNCGSLVAHQRVMRSPQLLCEKVMPQFR